MLTCVVFIYQTFTHVSFRERILWRFIKFRVRDVAPGCRHILYSRRRALRGKGGLLLPATDCKRIWRDLHGFGRIQAILDARPVVSNSFSSPWACH